MGDTVYVTLTALRLAACLRIAMWLYRSDASPLVQALGLYFYIVAGQRVIWLVRSTTNGFHADALMMVGTTLELATLGWLTWRFYRKKL